MIEFLGRDPAVERCSRTCAGCCRAGCPEIVRDNRSSVTVAIGCTGGRHRSVYLAERLAEHFRNDWSVLVRHRGLAAANRLPSSDGNTALSR